MNKPCSNRRVVEDQSFGSQFVSCYVSLDSFESVATLKTKAIELMGKDKYVILYILLQPISH